MTVGIVGADSGHACRRVGKIRGVVQHDASLAQLHRTTPHPSEGLSSTLLSLRVNDASMFVKC